MPALIDTHVHIYPEYDPSLVFNAFRDNVIRSKSSCGVMMLTERSGTNMFETWTLGKNLPPGTDVVVSDETSILLKNKGAPDVVVVSGRQIECRERVEILALGTTHIFENGIPVSEAVREALCVNCLPVLAWGLGKWMFKRSRIVRKILDEFSPDQIVIGDTSLRPSFLPAPAIMKKAAAAKYKIVAGSDPLPGSDEAMRVGQYAEFWNGKLDTQKPLTEQIMAVLASGNTVRFGKMAGPFDLFFRAFVSAR